MAKFSDSYKSLGDVAQAHLKRCPLCDVLNAKENHECFVCGWKGTFDREPSHLEDSIRDLIDSCPNFQEKAAPIKNLKSRVLKLIRLTLRRKLDIQA